MDNIGLLAVIPYLGLKGSSEEVYVDNDATPKEGASFYSMVKRGLSSLNAETAWKMNPVPQDWSLSLNKRPLTRSMT